MRSLMGRGRALSPMPSVGRREEKRSKLEKPDKPSLENSFG